MTLSDAKIIADNPSAQAPTDCLNAFLRLKSAWRRMSHRSESAVVRMERRLDCLAAHLEAAGVKGTPTFSQWRAS